MPVSFYLIAIAVLLIISVFLYRATVKYVKKEFALRTWKVTDMAGVMRGILPVSLVITVLIMLAVQYFFY